jgi:hypothetical protein
MGMSTVALVCPAAKSTCCLEILVKLAPASSLLLVTPQQITPGAVALVRLMISR